MAPINNIQKGSKNILNSNIIMSGRKSILDRNQNDRKRLNAIIPVRNESNQFIQIR